MIKIFDSNDKNFNTNGNIAINPLKLIEVKKKSLNGWYIDVEVSIKYKDYIQQDKLCVVKTKSKLRPQAFRIGSPEYTQRKIIFRAEHVMFDARNYFLVNVRPTKLNGLDTLNYINERTDNSSPFNIIDSDVEHIDTCYFIRKNLLEAWSTIEERYNGIFDADNFDISFKSTIGVDRGETIVYKKNLQNIKVFEDWSNVCTRIYPVGKDGLTLESKFIDGEIQYERPYTKTISFDTELSEEEQTQENLLKELEESAENYLKENQLPLVSYEITSDINQLMEIGDKIHVKHPIVNILTEVLEYEYNGISKKIKKIIFGNYTRNVKAKFDNIKNSIYGIKTELSNQSQIISKQTELINSLNKNGYVYIDDNEILILDALPIENAKNVWRFGLGGLGFSSTGYKGPFKIAITSDGSINADFISTGKLSASLIEGYGELLLNVSKINNQIIPTSQVSGSHIHIEDSSYYPLINLEIEGKSEQETRSGKNLFKPTLQTTTVNGIICTNNGDGTYTLNGTATDNTSFDIFTSTTIPSGTYKLNGCPNGGSATTYYLIARFDGVWGDKDTGNGAIINCTNFGKLSLSVASGVKFTNAILKPMITSDDSLTYDDYEPYGVSPSPDYPSEIECVGYENLFTYETSTNDGWYTDIPNCIKKAGTYTLSINNPNLTGNWAVYFVDSSKQRIGSFIKPISLVSTPSIFEVTQEQVEAPYIRILPNEKDMHDIEIYLFQIVKGSIAKTYIPHGKYGIEFNVTNGTDTNTTLIILDHPPRSLPNGTKDTAYIKNNKLYIKRRIATIVLDGSETGWSYDETYKYFRCPTYDFGDKIPKSPTSQLCSHFNTIDNWTTFRNSTTTNAINSISNSGYKIPIRNTNCLSVDEFKTWLSENNVKIQYELAEPYTEEIGEIEMPSTFKGVTNITTTDKLEPIINLEYVRDTTISSYVEGQVNNSQVIIHNEMNAKFVLQKENIDLELSKKVNNKEIIAAINMSTESLDDGSNLQIKADKIDLKGKKINLTSDEITIESDNFSVTKEGKVTAKSGKIGGFTLNPDKFTAEISTTYTFTLDDLNKVMAYINDEETLSDEEQEKYDINGDGVVDRLDLLAMNRMYYEYISNIITGLLEINSTQTQRTFVLRDENGKIKTSVGLNGIVTPNHSCKHFTLNGIEQPQIQSGTNLPETVTDGVVFLLYSE